MNDLGVLVLSCDRYSSLWDLFFSRWDRFWKKCPYSVYLLSNQIEYVRPGIKTIRTGPDLDWSSNLLKVLDQIPHENLLLMIEDAPLNDFVNGLDFDRLLMRFENENLNYLNLKASPLPNGFTDNEMGELLPGSLYRTALVPCIWKKKILKSLAVEGESAWHFEILGAERADRYANFRSMQQPFFNLLHCIIRGKLDRRAAKILKKSGELQLLNFPIMTFGDQFLLVIREFRSYIFNRIVPSMMRRKLRSFYYKNLVRNGKIV